MEDKIFEIIIGAFKRKLIVSDMVEMNLIAKGIDEATKAHYMPVIEKQEELIDLYEKELRKQGLKYPDDYDTRLGKKVIKLKSELAALESEPAKVKS